MLSRHKEIITMKILCRLESWWCFFFFEENIKNCEMQKCRNVQHFIPSATTWLYMQILFVCRAFAYSYTQTATSSCLLRGNIFLLRFAFACRLHACTKIIMPMLLLFPCTHICICICVCICM